MIVKTKLKCKICGKLTRGRTPKGGDGSFKFPSFHNVDGKPCHGSTLEAEWVDIIKICNSSE